MTTWSQIEEGMIVLYDGGEHEGRHEVRMIKGGGSKLRVVLLPLDHGSLVPKLSLRVSPNDTVEVPGGEAAMEDRAENVIEEVLGGELLGTIDKKGNVTCPVMDATTIATHLKVMHGVELRGLPIADEDAMLKLHEELHEAPFHEPEHPHEHEETTA